MTDGDPAPPSGHAQEGGGLIPVGLFIALIGAWMEYLRRKRWIIRI